MHLDHGNAVVYVSSGSLAGLGLTLQFSVFHNIYFYDLEI